MKKKILLLVILVAVLAGLLAFPFRHKIKRKIRYVTDRSMNLIFGRSNSCDNCATLFDDKVTIHEQAYLNEGILPQDSDDGLKLLLANETLVELRSSQYYIVRNFKYSKPYLLPTAQAFIDTLANTYTFECKARKLTYLPFTISSGTRSVASVEKLMKSNSNSIKNSSHLKGKTFDVSYTAFGDNKQQLKAFISALDQLRREEKCYVKYERNGTLHITVI
ncbi:hypothetical protein H8S95_01705 [Pontibacter sp. KCTC 32443]|uniref:DUF5715 family protein n=1 Tax=Pontibacter TaxID=323449 RepID=UPI00164E042F|nr:MULTISPECIES: DUF5715 family protein [Pontibacter]MBC5772764.1 hypothetical protein [Pontibacter sp. KCTC 32443]